MCGRYTLTQAPADLAGAFGLSEVPSDYRPRYNVAPMQEVWAIIAPDGAPRIGPLRWGLVPPWAEDPAVGSRMINARSETVAEKPAFREAFRERRCVIPADGFYEWRKEEGGSTPVYVHLEPRRPFAFAGLWERWSGEGETLYTCTVLTTHANERLRPIHPRMPVMLDGDACRRWLDPDATPERLHALCEPLPAEALRCYDVSPQVNAVRNDDPSCLDPAPSPWLDLFE